MNELNDKYILGPDKIPVAEPDLYKWAQWFQCNDDARVVARDQIGESRVSTVFLGLDHNFMGDGPPILWETMVFGGHMDSEQDRCSGTINDAEDMHLRMVKKVEGSGT